MPDLSRRAFSLSLLGACVLPGVAAATSAPKPLRSTVMASLPEAGAGPTALPDGSVAMSQTKAGTIIRVFPTGATTVFVSPGAGVGGTALGPDGKLYVAKAATDGSSAILRVDLAAGTFHTLYDHAPTGPLQGPSAVVFDERGDIWFADATEGAVYWCRSDGSDIRRVVAGLAGANALALTPGQGTLYVAQGSLRQITAYRIARRGTLAAHRGQVRARNVCTLPGSFHILALAAEAGGNLVAACGAAGLTVITPGGRVVAQQTLPGLAPAGLGFSGASPATLFVAGEGATPGTGQLLSIAWPHRGLELNFD
jgi:gluconolactonase